MAKSPARGGKRPGDRDITRNREASFRYELLDTLECGIALTGTEVKALRDGGAHLRDAYAIMRGGELWLVGGHIPPYGNASRWNHAPDRDRKLSRTGGRSTSSPASSRPRGSPSCRRGCTSTTIRA